MTKIVCLNVFKSNFPQKYRLMHHLYNIIYITIFMNLFEYIECNKYVLKTLKKFNLKNFQTKVLPIQSINKVCECGPELTMESSMKVSLKSSIENSFFASSRKNIKKNSFYSKFFL